MMISFNECLLCNAELVESLTWVNLFRRTFSKTLCTQCSSKFVPLFKEIDGVFCMYEYNAAMKDYIHRYKFLGDVLLAHVFRSEIAQTIQRVNKQFQQLYNLKSTAITPIPLHPMQLRLRTFSQVDELLKAANIPYVHVLNKITTEMQSKKNRQQRLETKILFTWKETAHIENVLLFDDIKTTGKTLSLAKQCLHDNGIKHVACVALAASL